MRIPAFIFSLLTGIQGAIANDQILDYEQGLLNAIELIQHSDHDQALADTRKFLRQYPTSKLGQLLYADLLMAKAEVLPSIGFGIQKEPGLSDLTFEIRQRLSSQKTPADEGLLPENLIAIADRHPYILVMDQSLSRLFVYRNDQGTPVLERDFFLSIGLKGTGKQYRGDQKTPIGIYHVTRYIDGDELPDLYGSGAFPVNYPNTWDIRKKRTGGGIWIHGTPSYTYNRAPWSSNGCMVVSNPDFEAIQQYIDPLDSTPVIVSDRVNWISTEQWRDNQKQMLQSLTRWIKDWESNQHQNYVRHYSRSEFFAYGRDFSTWSRHKEWVNRDKSDVKVEFNQLNIYFYPGEEAVVMMQFNQQYQSNNFNNKAAKELFWKKEGPSWKIVYEGVRELESNEESLAVN